MRNRERWKGEGYRVRKEREKRERKCGARERWVERGLDDCGFCERGVISEVELVVLTLGVVIYTPQSPTP